MFSVAANVWPGLAKLNEEAGEVVQIIGKLMQTEGSVTHWSGDPLDQRLTDELADLQAAIDFVLEHNPDIDRERWRTRRAKKLDTFNHWRRQQKDKT